MSLTKREQQKLDRLLKLRTDAEIALFDEVQEAMDEVEEAKQRTEQAIEKTEETKQVVEELRNYVDNHLIGPEGPRGKQGERGPKGEKGDRGEAGKPGKDGKGKDGRDGIDGLDGKDGSPDTGAEIVEKINGLSTWSDDLKIDASHIKNLPKATGNGGVFSGIFSGRDGHIIIDETTPLPQRPKLKLTGTAVTATDDGANDQTVITITGGGGAGSSVDVNQAGHGLSVGDVVKSSGINTYAKAQADSSANAEVVGCVTAVADLDNFTITLSGEITTGVPAVAAGTVLFLSPSSAGALTATEPSTANQVSKPLAIVAESGARMFWFNFRGSIIASPSTSGHIIQEEGASLTTRSKLNFISSNLTAADDAGNDATTVTLTSSPSFSDVKITSPTNVSTSALTTDGTQTLTNKRITPRVNTEASSSTSTPTGDSSDAWTITALAAADTIAAPTGSPTNMQKLIIRIKDNGTARALSWNGIYRASSDLALPTTTILGKTMYCGFIYNSADSKWDLLSLLNNF